MIEAELRRFGDKRLACAGGALLAAMQRKRTFCARLGKDRNQAIQFGRFLANPAVTAHEMLAATGRLTNQRAAGRASTRGSGLVLAIMETTELNFSNHEASQHGFGNCGNGMHPGLFLHPVLAVDADKSGVIGLLDCVVLNRTEGLVTDHKQRNADDKEARRWLLVSARDGAARRSGSALPSIRPRCRRWVNSMPASTWRTAGLKNLHEECLLAWYAWIVAGLGGWSGYTSREYKPPDPKPCIMASASSTRFWPAGAWQIDPRMCASSGVQP